MAVSSVNKLRDESGDQTVEGFTYRETWQVRTTNGDDTSDVVLSAVGLPTLGQQFGGDPLSIVSSRRPVRDSDSRVVWNVEIGYSREKASQEDKQQPPTLRPVKRSTGTKWVEKALMRDNTRSAAFPDGKPILTSAKTPFNPPITITVPHPTASFMRWENATGPNSFSTQTKINYEGKVNSAQFGVFTAGYVLCTGINGSEEWEQDANGTLKRYWMVTYEFEYNPDGWNPTLLLDEDYWFIDPADSKRKPIYVDPDGAYGGPDLANGVPIPSPIPLSGVAGSVGDVLQASELPESVHYLEFNIYLEADFNALGLPV